MIEYILKERKDLTESELLRLVREKKEQVGAGYLTDQGALFLVAADLGINIEQPSLDVGLKDIYSGARDINVIARVMKIYPIRRIVRSDGSSTMLRRLLIYDNDSKVRVNLWDNLALLPDSLGLKIGSAIKLNKVYAKSAPNGSIVLNASNRSSIELLDDAPIKDIQSLALDPFEVNEERDIIVKGIVSNPPRVAEFIDARGEKSKVLHMQISSISDEVKMRVIIWNVDENNIPKIIKQGYKVMLIGVNAKRNQFGDLELHGDEGSKVMVEEQEEQEPDIIQLRIVSVASNDKTLALAIDKDSNARVLSITKTANLAIDELKDGMLIECIPSRIYGDTIILDEDSYARVLDEDINIPKPEMLEVKIKDIKPDNRIYFLEGIILLPPKVQEVQIKDENINYAETLIGDDTGEIRLVGWRESANMLDALNTGKKVKVYGVGANIARDGSLELRLKPFSRLAIVD